jgi:hypothetical protein
MLKGVCINQLPIEELHINKWECLTEDLSDKNRRHLKRKRLLSYFSIFKNWMEKANRKVIA